MPVRPTHSLRARLLWLLLAAIAVTALVQGGIAYRSARAEADALFDYHMQQMAMSLRAGLPAHADGPAPDDPAEEAGLNFVVQVWTADGLRVFQSATRNALPRHAVLGFSDVTVQGSTYRVFSMRSRAQVIQVAQDMAVRREMAGTMALRTLAPIAVMAPLLMLLVWWAVSRSMAPVSRVRDQLAQRQADDLSEVSPDGLPDEVQPLVQELNLLFGRLRQAFDAQTHFVADAAHELRSPLAALKLQLQGLQRAGDEPTRAQAIGRLSAGIDRATRLVEQLLALARQQASATAGTPPQPVVLADLARQALADAAPAAQARRIDLGLGRADDAPLTGHAEALRILLRNLIDNAIRYTPEGGRVDVAVQRAGPGLRLAVDDSGPGIAEADRARVLDRFYRVPGTATTGSGLGLAIVKSIADLHGAQVRLERADPLGGLRVVVDFPLCAEAARAS